MIIVVNKYKHTPTENDVYIGRGSVLGNPFTSIKDKTTKVEFICESREESVERFKEYILSKILEGTGFIVIFSTNTLSVRLK